MPGPEPTVLVVGPAWIGDMVMAQSLFITLRERGATVDVLAPGWSAPLLARMPQVRAALDLPLGHGELGLLRRYRVGGRRRERRYDQAIVIPRSLKAALAPFIARIPRRTGYRGEWRYGLINDMRTLDKRVLTQTVQRYVALGLEAHAPQPPPVPTPRLTIDEASRARLLATLGLTLERPILGLMPGAEYGPAKRWPVEHFVALARAAVGAGLGVWVFGSPKERPLGELIAAGQAHVTNLCGGTRLEDVVDLVSLCRVVVTNDSGLMHIAAATGRPLVAIYGSSTPAYTPPLTAKATTLYRGLACSPCFERACPLGHMRCLYEITPPEVLAACTRLMEETERVGT